MVEVLRCVKLSLEVSASADSQPNVGFTEQLRASGKDAARIRSMRLANVAAILGTGRKQ
jgi:hypothetical protein